MEVVVFLLLLESLGKVPSSFSFLRGCGLGCIASNPVKITVEELATLSLSSDGSAEEREREREREREGGRERGRESGHRKTKSTRRPKEPNGEAIEVKRGNAIYRRRGKCPTSVFSSSFAILGGINSD